MKTTLLILTTLLSLHLSAQVYIPGDDSQPLDLLNDTTTLNFYTSVKTPTSDGFRVVDPQLRFTYNSAYPRGYNDGPVWKGKGLTSEVHAGIYGKRGIVSYAFVPVVYHSQNAFFELPFEIPGTPFRYPLVVHSVPNRGVPNPPGGFQIDWPVRFGDASFYQFHPGQSALGIHLGKFSASISTQNYQVGPSHYHPIMLSRQAAGFPHLRLALAPASIGMKDWSIGQLEAQYLAGILRESKFFDAYEPNNRRYFNALFLSYRPSFLPNLSVGFNKSLYQDLRFFEPLDLLSPIKIFDNGVLGDSIVTNDSFDGLASVTLSWTFPEVGFRAYGEFAKNDFTGGFRWTAIEPEHSRAYTVGFEKFTTTKSGSSFRLIYEHTNLSRNHTYLWRAEPPFYAHEINRQGYTHLGQVLGAGIGPGSNTDIASFCLDQREQSLALTLQRIEHNKDYYIVYIQPNTLFPDPGEPNPIERHNVEYSATLYYQRQVYRLLLSCQSTLSYNYNWYFTKDRTNLQLGLSAKWLLSQ